jgi:hypothetical protein
MISYDLGFFWTSSDVAYVKRFRLLSSLNCRCPLLPNLVHRRLHSRNKESSIQRRISKAKPIWLRSN